MFKKSMRLFTTLIIICLVISFSGCSKKTDSNSIRIGVLVPTSGSEANSGKDMLQAYQLAVDEINAAGGILGRNVTLYHADDGCAPNIATQAAARIITQGVDFVVGGYSSVATIPTLQQFYDANRIMLISSANSTEITKLGYNQTFMLNSPGTHASVTLTDLCKWLNVKKVAIIHQGDAYTQNLADICENVLPENGLKIATVQVMEKNDPDVSAIVTSIRNSGADFVYWCGLYADGSNVVKQLRQGRYTGIISAADGAARTEFITACGSAGEGVYITAPPFVQFAKGGDKFAANYKAKWGAEPGPYATLSYDTIYVLKKAIEKANTIETAKVRDAIQEIEYNGLSGLIKFTAKRELAVSNFIVLKIENGKFKLVTLK